MPLNLRPTLRHFLFCLALALTLVGCAGDVTVESPEAHVPETPTEPVLILIGGQCRADNGRIECEDSSTSTPARHLVSVRWDLRDAATGISQDRRQNPPLAEVSFSGLEAGSYEVEQTVLADDGSSASQVHGGLEITN